MLEEPAPLTTLRALLVIVASVAASSCNVADALSLRSYIVESGQHATMEFFRAAAQSDTIAVDSLASDSLARAVRLRGERDARLIAIANSLRFTSARTGACTVELFFTYEFNGRNVRGGSMVRMANERWILTDYYAIVE